MNSNERQLASTADNDMRRAAKIANEEISSAATDTSEDPYERAATLVELSHISWVTPQRNGEIVRLLAQQIRNLGVHASCRRCAGDSERCPHIIPRGAICPAAIRAAHGIGSASASEPSQAVQAQAVEVLRELILCADKGEFENSEDATWWDNREDAAWDRARTLASEAAKEERTAAPLPVGDADRALLSEMADILDVYAEYDPRYAPGTKPVNRAARALASLRERLSAIPQGEQQ